MPNRNRPIERRAYPCQVRVAQNDSGGAVLTGRPIVYDSRTDIAGLFSEVIEPGALEGCNLKDVRFLVNHNFNMIPLARSRNNNENSTMQLTPDKEGMGIRVNLDTEGNSDARNLHSAVGRGDVSGMSFCFIVADDEWENMDSDYPHHRIRKIAQVIEVSAVTWPAYEDTEINARGRQTLESARAALESARGHRPLESEALALEKMKAHYLWGV